MTADDPRGLALAGLDNPKCQRCGGPHQFDTSIASPLWNRVIRDTGEADYLCASCIVLLFVRAETSFEAELFGAAVDIYGAEVPTINVQVGTRPLDRSYGHLQAQLREAVALPHGPVADPRTHKMVTDFSVTGSGRDFCLCGCPNTRKDWGVADPRVAELEAALRSLVDALPYEPGSALGGKIALAHAALSDADTAATANPQLTSQDLAAKPVSGGEGQ